LDPDVTEGILAVQRSHLDEFPQYQNASDLIEQDLI
jgi:hypothetical protein